MELSTQNRNLADRLIAEMHSPGLVPQERIEFYLFDFLIQLIEDSSQWRHLCRMGVRTVNDYRDARVRKVPTICSITWMTRRQSTMRPKAVVCRARTSIPCFARTPACPQPAAQRGEDAACLFLARQ